MSFISLNDAVDLTSEYRSSKASILQSQYQATGVLPICETFDKDEVQTLLNQSNCDALRIYLSMDSNLNVKLVLVGVNSSGDDITSDGGGGDAYIIEEGIRCPTNCPSSSPLNS